MPWTKEERRDYMRAYHEANRGKQREASKKWRDANKENKKAYMKKWSESNKEKLASLRKDWKEKNRGKELASKKKYREANMHKIKESHAYAKWLLIESGFSKESLERYPELIKTHRQILKIKRLCKSTTSKN